MKKSYLLNKIGRHINVDELVLVAVITVTNRFVCSNKIKITFLAYVRIGLDNIDANTPVAVSAGSGSRLGSILTDASKFFGCKQPVQLSSNLFCKMFDGVRAARMHVTRILITAAHFCIPMCLHVSKVITTT